LELDLDIVGLGLAEKQTGRARQAFERSAEQAGFKKPPTEADSI
jgi:hypothetical protein